jgi:hypothetical protein
LHGFGIKLSKVDQRDLSEDISFEMSRCKVEGVAERPIVLCAILTRVLDKPVSFKLHASLIEYD